MSGCHAFVDLGDFSVRHPDGCLYKLAGGHRRWVAPQDPEVTYEPVDDPVDVEETERGLDITQAAGAIAGIEKRLRIEFVGESVLVEHTLTNRRVEKVRITPWAITQLPVNGTAVLPLPDLPVDSQALQPNAEIVLWPYVGLADTTFELQDRLVLVAANRSEATKIGTSLDRRWLAYLRDGLVFVRRASAVAGSEYLDRGVAAQWYCSADFVELETLGPVTTLWPEQSSSHDETRQLFEIDPTINPYELPSVLDLDAGGTI